MNGWRATGYKGGHMGEMRERKSVRRGNRRGQCGKRRRNRRKERNISY